MVPCIGVDLAFVLLGPTNVVGDALRDHSHCLIDILGRTLDVNGVCVTIVPDEIDICVLRDLNEATAFAPNYLFCYFLVARTVHHAKFIRFKDLMGFITVINEFTFLRVSGHIDISRCLCAIRALHMKIA